MDATTIFWIFVAILGLIILLILSLTTKRKPRREYGVKSVTAKGEGVRSIAERKIADYFAKNKIKYIYERELRGRFLF
jgi:hypothetical protein